MIVEGAARRGASRDLTVCCVLTGLMQYMDKHDAESAVVRVISVFRCQNTRISSRVEGAEKGMLVDTGTKERAQDHEKIRTREAIDSVKTRLSYSLKRVREST